jgi:hypothetical protein
LLGDLEPPTDIEIIRGIARSLNAHPMIQLGLLGGAIEQSLIWPDKKTGLYLKNRPDAIPNDSGDFADLKLTSDIGDRLDFSITDYGYDVQAALTKWGCREVLGRDLTSYALVFVESKAPYCIQIVELDARDIEDAEQSLRVAVDTFAWCLESGNWFGTAGTQMDARPARISDRAREHAQYRRDFLRREIARPLAAVGEPIVSID